MWIRTLPVLLAVALTGCPVGPEPIEASYFSLSEDRFVEFEAPPHAELASVTITGPSSVEFRMRRPVPAEAAEPLVIVAVLRSASARKAVIASVKAAAPVREFGDRTALVVDLATSSVEDVAALRIVQGRLSAEFPRSNLSGTSLDFATSYCLPASVDPEDVAGGIYGAPVSTIETASEPPANRMEAPVALRARAASAPDFVPVGAVRLNFEPGSRCPPDSNDHIREANLDGDPVTREVVYERSTTDLGAGDIAQIVGWIGPPPSTGANSAFQLLIAEDDNGDGKMQDDELSDGDPAGQCVYARGLNSAFRLPDGTILWISRDRDASLKLTGKVTVFRYRDGNLQVQERRPYGNSWTWVTVYDGPAADYPGFWRP